MAVPEVLLVARQTLEDSLGNDVLNTHQTLAGLVEKDALSKIVVHLLAVMKGLYLVAEVSILEVKAVQEDVELAERVDILSFLSLTRLNPTLYASLLSLLNTTLYASLLSLGQISHRRDVLALSTNYGE